MGGLTLPADVAEDILLARAYLSRVAEPTCIPLWAAIARDGPVEVARAVRRRTGPAEILSATEARARTADPLADLEAAERSGVRLVVPESADWPHFALACLEHTGRRRLATFQAGDRQRAHGGEPIPPLALWVRGTLDTATLGIGSVAIVGSRAATTYGKYVTGELVAGLVEEGWAIVSGGAHGIDAAAHRSALRAQGVSVLVSAGGLDRAYPPAHVDLFERTAQTGLLVSESPPGAAPARHRFLTRNRLIAALSSGTVVTEAALRSGALNTAGHCLRLGRPVMVVPGPVTSAASAGVHDFLFRHPETCRLVTRVAHVVEVLGGAVSSNTAQSVSDEGQLTGSTDPVRPLLDGLDDATRAVYDGFPARRPVSVDELAVVANMVPSDVMRALPTLELHGLVTGCAGGYRRVGKPAPRAVP